jgi:glycosyltransferase involved in cell wall biosynthesis
VKEHQSKIAIDNATSPGEAFAKTARPLRVLVVGPSLDILGGQAVQAARLIVRLREVPSFAVDFLPINPRCPGLLGKLQAIKYVRTLITSLFYVFSLLSHVPKCDVLHIFSASYFSFVLAPTPAILIGKLFGKRTLLNYHSGEAEDHFQRWPSAIATLRLVDEVVVPSEYLVRVFRKFHLPARAINNLVELDNFTFRERSPLKPVFLSNRNLEKHYGVDQVLRAFALIQKQLPDACLIVAGDGTEGAALHKLALDLDLRKTEFAGQTGHHSIAQLYQSADIYLNGSEIDNQPLSILEAFACGLPVVTTNAGGIPDMVCDGVSGFVVERGDYPAMAERAMHLLENAQVASTITRNALAGCEKYSWRAVGEQWVDSYRALAAKNSRQPNPAKSFAKLRCMSFAELRVRSAQGVAAFSERHGWSRLTKLPSDAGLLKSLSQSNDEKPFHSATELFAEFRARKRDAVFASFADREKTIAEFRRRFPSAEKEIVTQANRIVSGRFDLLGFPDLDFGTPINWLLEPVSGKAAPQIHWSRLNYLDAELVGDKKITWELNRHQYFVKLGQAYCLTGDEQYASTFAAHLESWMDQNPPKRGLNWASSLEIALRSISWLWALEFFKDSSSISADLYKRVLKFLYLNARHLETYLSTYFSPNTHLTGEALGLFYLGTFLPEFKEAERWRRRGQQILIEQMSRQVRADGVYFEQSSYYHRYTTDFYTHFLILSRLNDGRLPVELETVLQSLLDHLMHITRPNGTTPLFGDDDGGRLLFLDRRPVNDFRAALSNGAVLFRRGDYKYVADKFAEETFWLFGPESAQQFDEIQATAPGVDSKDFPSGGYYVMRDGWTAQANYLLFDCGPHGTDNCGHAHADALAIEVAAQGRSLLIDPGTFTYTGSKAWRDWFRSSAAHNTLTIDGKSSSTPAGPFSWSTMAKCEPLAWLNERRFTHVEGEHNGYEILPAPAIHNRSILFLKHDYWVMRDRVTSTGEHDLELRFHFPADATAELRFDKGSAQTRVKSEKSPGLQVFSSSQTGRWSREEGPVSHCYGSRAAAPVCVFSAHSKGSTELLTLLIPLASGKSEFEVQEVEAIGGRAIEITGDRFCDFIMLRDDQRSVIETVRFISDFKWTWARFDRNGSQLIELMVMDGQQLQVDGKATLKSARPIRYVVATRVGNQFRLETPEGAIDMGLPVHDLEALFTPAPRQMEV